MSIWKRILYLFEAHPAVVMEMAVIANILMSHNLWVIIWLGTNDRPLSRSRSRLNLSILSRIIWESYEWIYEKLRMIIVSGKNDSL